MTSSPIYLLLQVRLQGDPALVAEQTCFAQYLGVSKRQVQTFDLLQNEVDAETIGQVDAFLVGGSGDFSATSDEPWMQRALVSLRRIADTGKPVFASCWGFQAFARALGGELGSEPAFSELGTGTVEKCEAAENDPVFGPLPKTFPAPMGHEDSVLKLPNGAILLATSARCRNQAFRLADRPFYATQFHPELSRQDLMRRLETYPKYVEKLSDRPFEEFMASLVEVNTVNTLLKRFHERVVSQPGMKSQDDREHLDAADASSVTG